MGAWGFGSFENDPAMDWVLDLIDGDGSVAVSEALTRAEEGSDYLEVDEGSAAICAAEVVAALHGHAATEMPDELKDWLKGRRLKDAELVQRAMQAVKHVARESETQELWEESVHYEDWKAAITDLLERLRKCLQ